MYKLIIQSLFKYFMTILTSMYGLLQAFLKPFTLRIYFILWSQLWFSSVHICWRRCRRRCRRGHDGWGWGCHHTPTSRWRRWYATCCFRDQISWSFSWICFVRNRMRVLNCSFSSTFSDKSLSVSLYVFLYEIVHFCANLRISDFSSFTSYFNTFVFSACRSTIQVYASSSFWKGS